MLERDVEAYATRRVKAMGGEIRKVKWINRGSAPDRIVMLPSTYTMDGRIAKFWHERSAWVEFKHPGTLATFPANAHERAQHREHERMRKMGQRVEVIGTLAGVDKLLEG